MTLFRGGTLVTHEDVVKADLRVKDGKIAAIGPGLEPLPGERVYDIQDKLLLPGIIDGHTHFLLKARNAVTADDVFWGGVSAAFGGVTTVIDYADMLPEGMCQGVRQRDRDFDGQAAVDYSFHLVVNDHYHPDQAQEFIDLKAMGIDSIKMFTTYRDAGYMLAQEKWRSILEGCRKAKILVTVHAEDDEIVEAATQRGKELGKVGPEDHPDLRPAKAEEEAVSRLIELARETECPIYIVHISSGKTRLMVRNAQEEGVPIIGETAPHYLLLDREALKGSKGCNNLMTPPLRTPEDNALLWQGVEDGDISVIATDHCAFTQEQKALGESALDILPGIPGVETLLPLVYSYGVGAGRIDLPRLVQLLCANPAKIFGLWPQKGCLEVGADADLVVYDPRPSWQLTDDAVHSQAGYTPFKGMQVRGQVELTMSRGKVLVEHREFIGERGHGKFVPARP